MNRYKNFNPDQNDGYKNKEKMKDVPPVLKEEILVDGLSFMGRNEQIYEMTIMADRRTFRIKYPDTYFLLKDGNFDEADLVVKMGGEPEFFKWVKIMLKRYGAGLHTS